MVSEMSKNSIGGKHSAKEEFYGEFFKYDASIIKKREMNKSSVFPFGIPKGATIAVIGSPKTGKTSVCLQECIEASAEGADCLYIINESPKERFMEIVQRHAHDLGRSSSDLERLTFLDMYGQELGSANYESIRNYIARVWGKKLKYWLEKSINPRYVVFDSFSKIGRKYIPQMFVTMEELYKTIVNSCQDTNKRPSFLLVNQKSGSSWSDKDDTVVGGYGIVHECDGTILFMKNHTDIKTAKFSNLVPGTRFYTVRFDMRDIDVPDEEMVMTKINGKFRLGISLSDYINSGGKKEKPKVEYGYGGRQ